MRQVNTRFFFILVGIVAAIAAGLFGVHCLQAGNIANALLWQADQAEKAGKAQVAAKYLGQYLQFVPTDMEQHTHLATVLSDPKVATTPKARRRAERVINEVLARDPQRHALRLALVRMMLADQQLDAAEEQLKILQVKLPNSSDVALYAGQWQEQQTQVGTRSLTEKDKAAAIDAAIKSYRKAITADPRNADAYLRLVALYKRLDFGKAEPKYTGAIDELVSAALKHLPDDGSVLGLAAQQAQEKGDNPAALAYLETGLKRNPSEPTLYLALARLHNQMGKRSLAIEQLTRGLDKVEKEQRFGLRWMLGNLLLDDDQLEPARKIIAEIRGGNTLSADYLESRCLMIQGLWSEAALRLERVRPAFKTVAELVFQTDLYLGLCYQKMGDPLRQQTAFERAVKADPTSVLARQGVAMALASLGRRQDALTQLTALINDNAGRSEANGWRLDVARMLLEPSAAGDAQAAAQVRSLLGEVEKDTTRAVECALVRAALMVAEKKLQAAQAELHRIIHADPKRFEPWIALAELAMEAQQPQPAAAILTKAAATVPDTIDFRLARVQFWSRYGKDRTEVLAGLEQNASGFPAKQQARLLEALADAHHRANRPAEAARLLRQLAALPPHAEDVRVRMLLLSLAIAQDDEPEMQRVLSEIKKIEGETATEWSYGEARHLLWRARRTPDERKELLGKARNLLNVCAARRNNWPPVFIARGELDELEQKTDQAIASYRQAIDLGSRDPHCVYQLLELLTKARRSDEVEQLIRKMDQVGMGTPIQQLVVFKGVLNGQEPKMALEANPKLFRADSKNYRDHLLRGQLLSSGGRVSPEAEAALRRAVALGGSQPETWVALVRYLGSTGQYNQALEEIGKAGKQLDERVKLPAQAACLEVLGALDEAERMFRKALAEEPRSAQRHRLLADFLLRFGKPLDAEPLYRAVLDGKLGASEEETTAARRGLAQALARGGNPRHTAEALELVGLKLDAAGNVEPKSVAASTEMRLTQARVLAALGSHALRTQAIALLEPLYQKQALVVEDQYQLALLLHLAGPDAALWKKARDILTAITTQQPQDARYLASYANLLLVHKEAADAEPLIARLEQLERERKLAMGLLGAVELKARALELRGKEQQAVALLQEYAQQTDALPVRKLLLAALHGRLGNYEEAIELCYEVKAKGLREESYAAAIGLMRAGKPPANQKAKLARWQPQMARLEESLRESIRLDEKNVMLRLQLADLLDLAGRGDESAKTCRAVLEADANNLVALNNLAWMLAQQDGGGPEALSLIQRAIEQHGARPELLDTRAVVYLALGNAAAAVRDLEHAIREAPTPTRYFHLTRAHHLAKDAAAARVALERAGELGLDVQRLHPSDQRAYEAVVPDLRKQ